MRWELKFGLWALLGAAVGPSERAGAILEQRRAKQGLKVAPGEPPAAGAGGGGGKGGGGGGGKGGGKGGASGGGGGHPASFHVGPPGRDAAVHGLDALQAHGTGVATGEKVKIKGTIAVAAVTQ